MQETEKPHLFPQTLYPSILQHHSAHTTQKNQNLLAVHLNSTVENQEVRVKMEIEEESSNQKNKSKEFLKFSRKLAGLVLSHLQAQSELLRLFLFTSGKLINIIFRFSNLNTVNLSELLSLQIECLNKLWVNYKETISYSTNKKICIVKSETWYKLYSKPDFIHALKDILSTLAKSYPSLNILSILQLEHVFVSFASILFHTNQIFSYLLIIKDPTAKGEYLRNLKALDNFLLLMLSPELYKSYNHRSGRFAFECCGKCKVCRSKSIMASFPLQLEKARTKSELMKTYISLALGDLGRMSEEQIYSFYCLVMKYI